MEKRTVGAMKIAVIVSIAMSLTGCMGCARINPGHVGIKSTMAGTGRGLSDVAVGPAWVFYNSFTESVLEYPTFMQTAVWTASTTEGKPSNEEITFTTKDSLQVAADISLSYTLLPEKVAAFYIKFRSDDLNSFTHGFLRNVARDSFNEAAGHYSIEQIMGDNAPFIKEARATLQNSVESFGVHIEQFGVIGAPRPPQGVIDSINAKVKATQLAIQKQNEVAQAEADARKTVAVAEGDAKATLTRAQAQAEANRKLAESVTSNLIEYRKLEKWDGHLPQVQGSGGGILLNMDKK